MRDVRDYRIHDVDNQIVLGGSTFNIKSGSLRLGNFSREEVVLLYDQHTQEAGQGVRRRGDRLCLRADRRSQPWLVNVLGYETCFRAKAARDRTWPIDLTLLTAARERLIERRDTHLDQLTNQLREIRVH